jgi:hypothetical protein
MSALLSVRLMLVLNRLLLNREYVLINALKIRVKVTSRLSVSQSVCLGVEYTLWTFEQVLLPFKVFGSGICCPVSVGCPLWREAGTVLCKSQSSHLIVWTFIINIFVFHTFIINIHYIIHIIYTRPLVVPAWYSSLLVLWRSRPKSGYVKVLNPLWDLWPNITSCPNVVVWKLLSCLCGAPSMTRGRVCHLSFSVYCNLSVFT